MSKIYSYKDALILAKLEVLRKVKQGEIVANDDNSETLFEVAMVYAQFVDDDFSNASDALLCDLQEIYPDLP